MNSQCSIKSITDEIVELKLSVDTVSPNDGWTTIPKKKPKRKNNARGIRNMSLAAPAYEQNINMASAPLPDQRIAYVSKLLRLHGVKTILELGCGDLSNSIQHLRTVEKFTSLTAVDIDALELKNGLIYAKGDSKKPSKVRVFCGDATAPCREWLPPPSHDKPPDAVISLEVVEHLHVKPLNEFPHAIFGMLQPRVAILTTPNEDYNVVLRRIFGTLSFKNRFRHHDHKFE